MLLRFGYSTPKIPMISVIRGFQRRFRTAEVEKDFLEKPLWEW